MPQHLEPRALLTSNISATSSGDVLELEISPALPPSEYAVVYFTVTGSPAEDNPSITSSVQIQPGTLFQPVYEVSQDDADGDAGSINSATLTITNVTATGGAAVSWSNTSASVLVSETDGTSNSSSTPSISLTGATADEGAPETFTVNVSGLASGQGAWVNYNTADGTAKATTDYTSVASSTFVPGNGSYNITVQTRDDLSDASDNGESSQSFTLSASIAGGNTATALGYVTEPTPTLSVTAPPPTDEGQPLTFTVTWSGFTSGSTISLSTAPGGAAIPETDYYPTPNPSAITVGTSESGSTTVVVTSKDDGIANETQGESITLSAVATAASAYGVGSLLEDGDPAPTVSIGDAQDYEPGALQTSSLTFTVTMSEQSAVPITVGYQTLDGTDVSKAVAVEDYGAQSSSVVFAAYQTTQLIAIPIYGDPWVSSNSEDFYVQLSPPQNGTYAFGRQTGTGVILQQSQPGVTVSDAIAQEPFPGQSGIALTFDLTVYPAAASAVAVEYSTVDGSAIAGTDYQGATSSWVTIPAGSSTGQIIVPLDDDDASIANESAQQMSVTLLTATSATITTWTATGTIDEDTPDPDDAQPTVSISGGSTSETSAAMAFTVTLSKPSAAPVAVEYSTVDGSAIGGTDYQSVPSAWVTIPASSTTAVISIALKDDDTLITNESDQQFTVSLVTATSATIAQPTATGTITEDANDPNDGPPSVSISDAAAPETASSITFTVSLSKPSAQNISVPFATQNGAVGKSGEDYVGTTGTLLFTSGQAQQTIAVTITNDPTVDDPNPAPSDKNKPATNAQEPDADFTVTLSPPSNATLSRATGNGLIYDGVVPKNQAQNCICTCSCPTVENNTNSATGSADQHIGSEDPNAGLAKNPADEPHPVITVRDELTPGVTAATDVKVQLTFATLAPTTVYYNPASYVAGQVVDFAQQVDAGSLAPGDYNWTMTITEEYSNAASDITRTYTGSYDVQNLDQSPFGAGWMAQALDQLYIGSGGIDLGNANGDMYWFTQDPNNANNYLRPDGEPGFSTLVKNGDGTYTLTDKNGNVEDSGADGLITAKIDSDGNKTSFTFSGGLIQTITDPALRTTQFSYTGGLCTSITDIYGRTTTFSYTNGQLTTVTGPDPGNGEARLVTTFTYYPGTNEEETSTDATGTTTYSYDAYGALQKIVSPDGDVTTYSTPQDQALPAAGTGASANPAALVYDSSIRGTTTDPNGQTSGLSTTYTTGIYGLVTRSTDPTGATTTTVYNDEGEPLEIDAPMLTSGPYANVANKTTFSYDGNGNLVQETLPDGSSETWTFDPKWNEPVSYTDPAGRVTDWTLDPANGNVLSMTEVGVNSPSRTTTYAYTVLDSGVPAGLLAVEVDPRGIETQYEYTSHGLASTITYAVGTSEQAAVIFGYSPSDDLTSETDELGRTTSFQVDGLGRRIETDSPPPDPNQPTIYPKTNDVYDALGRLITETVLQSVQPTTVDLVTSYSYNADGQVTRIQKPDPTGGTNYTVTQNFYDGNGNLVKQISPSGHVTAWKFDPDNRVIAEQDPSPVDGSNNESFDRSTANGPVTTVGYDPLGNPVTQFNASGAETDNAFDLRGNLLSTTGPADVNGKRPTLQYGYSNDQEVTSETNALLGVTRLVYDDFGELVEEQDPSPDGGKTPGPISTWRFDGDGNRVAAVDANGNEREFIFNRRNLLDEEIAPAPTGGPVWQWVVDLAGEVTETIDPMQRVTQLVYDPDGRLVQTIAPNLATGGAGDASTTTTDAYDLAGDKISETTPLPDGAYGSATTTWQYDELGRVTQETQPVPGPGQSAPVWQYFYSPDGVLTKTIDPLGRTETTTPDGMDRPQSQTDYTGVTTAWTYDNLSQVKTITVGTGSLAETTTNGWDALGRKISVADANGTTQMGYDLNGNLTSLTDAATPSNTTTWQYDALDRPIRSDDALGNEHFPI